MMHGAFILLIYTFPKCRRQDVSKNYYMQVNTGVRHDIKLIEHHQMEV
jgi:hypothetical protein